MFWTDFADSWPLALGNVWLSPRHHLAEGAVQVIGEVVDIAEGVGAHALANGKAEIIESLAVKGIDVGLGDKFLFRLTGPVLKAQPCQHGG